MSDRIRLALEMLADAGQHGSTDPMFLARFTPELLDLMSDGLATTEREIRITRGRPFEVARVKITDEGWRALEGQVSLDQH
jgi:DNA-binding PadR family transcriptional regulator